MNDEQLRQKIKRLLIDDKEYFNDFHDGPLPGQLLALIHEERREAVEAFCDRIDICNITGGSSEDLNRVIAEMFPPAHEG